MKNYSVKHSIPWAILIARPILGFTVLWISSTAVVSNQKWIVWIIVAGIISDIFDGIIARLLNVSSDLLRRADSQADVIFWICILISTWLSFRDVVVSNGLLISGVLILEILTYIVSIIRFGKEHSVHAWNSKLWNIHMTIAFCLLFAGKGSFFLTTSLFHGLIALSEVNAILFILPVWHRDVPSFIHAIWIRKGKTFKRHKLLNG